MASSAYKNKTGLPFLFSFCLKFFNKLSENVGEAAGRGRGERRIVSLRRERLVFKAARVKICTADPFFVFNGGLNQQSGYRNGES